MDNKLKILLHLAKSKEKYYTMHELSGTLNIPYASFYRTINEMLDLITKTRRGQAYLVEIKANCAVTKSYLTIASEEQKIEYLKRQPIIKKIVSELVTKDVVVLFGSYVKNTSTEQSDIDLLVINSSGKKTISFSNYETLFKKKINPLFITFHEFKKMLRDKEENVGKQVLKDHIILNNPQKFWELAI